ncbi:MAG: ABC transporter permease [Actinomycetota bacterium]
MSALRPTAVRIATTLGVLVVAVALNFLIPRLMPGSPIAAIASGGDVGALSERQRDELLDRYDLNDPLVSQLAGDLADLARGDLGIALGDGRPVSTHIGEAIWWTMLLVGSALVITTVLGVVIGAIITTRRKRRSDTAGLTVSLVIDALPEFWVGMLLILLFGTTLELLPTFGATSAIDGGGALDVARHLVLPLTTLVLTGLGQTYLVTRSSLLTVMGSTHLQHARARGVPEGRLRYRHTLRAAALPVHTLVLLEVGWLVSGAVVVETVFAYPGLGRLVFDAVQARDYPLLQGAFLMLTVTVVVANLIADLTYPLIDPRVRSGAAV